MKGSLNILSINKLDWLTILQQVHAGKPEEVCGLMFGVGGLVKLVYPVPNTAPNPAVGFRMHPRTQVEALLMAGAHGWDLVAIYHSHPPGADTLPSATDVIEAAYPEAFNLILVPDPSSMGVIARAFSIVDGQVTDVSLIIK